MNYKKLALFVIVPGLVLLAVFLVWREHRMTESLVATSQPTPADSIAYQPSPTAQATQATGFDDKQFFASLSACTEDDQFTVFPLPLDRFGGIAPLGTVEASSNHVLPVDHLYVAINRGGDPIPVSAPGNVTIYRVSDTTRFRPDRSVIFRDFALYLTPCNQIETSYGHIRNISKALEKAIATAQKDCQPEYSVGSFTALACTYYPNYHATAGEVIGSLVTGGDDPNFDVSAIDRRGAPLAFANPERYRGNQQYIACGLDLFTSSVKATLYDRLGLRGDGTKRTIEPRCGTIMQDVPGTMQGNWFDGPGEWGQLEASGKAIAFVHQNTDPSIGVVSLGRGFGTTGEINFTPRHSGSFNRDFREVTADGTMYCYTGNIAHDARSLPGKLIAQVVDATSLRVEYQTGSCDTTETFTEPRFYTR